jgi:hypothetical protein
MIGAVTGYFAYGEALRSIDGSRSSLWPNPTIKKREICKRGKYRHQGFCRRYGRFFFREPKFADGVIIASRKQNMWNPPYKRL